MYDERIDKMVLENPSLDWLKKIADKGIVVISPNVQKYESDVNQIKLLGYDDKTISRQLIIDVISHDDSFKKIKKLYENNLHGFMIMFVDEKGNFINQYSLNKMRLIDVLKRINIQEFPFIKERYKELMDEVSYEIYKEKTKNDIYEVNIDGQNYKIPVLSIYEFMDLDSDVFNKILAFDNNFNNIYLPHFLYAVYRYFDDNKITDNYIVADKLKARLQEINSSKKVDVQMLNKYIDTSDSFLDQMDVDIELQNLILSDILPDFSDLEKAIYVYIKMCKVLTYDEEFYAVNQKGPLSKKHKIINNVINVSLSNNKVVCYEFDAIYAFFLHKLGINYRHFVGIVDGNNKLSEEEFDEEFHGYGEGHTFLKFRCGKYLIKADSVTSILQGDIIQAKLNQPLKGLTCENINELSKKEFGDIMHRVYRYIASEEPKISQNEVDKIETFEEIVSQFCKSTDKLKSIDLKEKVDILIDKVNSTKLVGIDAYGYLLQLRKILFTPQELKDNIRISIIRNSIENSAEAISIISIRLPGEVGHLTETKYVFRPASKLIPISKEELQANFNEGVMGYIETGDPTIPGIKR